MDDPKLTLPQTKQEHDAAELLKRIEPLFRDEARRVAGLLAGKSDDQILGKTEFELRDLLMHLGAVSFETALRERKKGGTAGRA